MLITAVTLSAGYVGDNEGVASGEQSATISANNAETTGNLSFARIEKDNASVRMLLIALLLLVSAASTRDGASFVPIASCIPLIAVIWRYDFGVGKSNTALIFVGLLCSYVVSAWLRAKEKKTFSGA
jgi:hypothetical protein